MIGLLYKDLCNLKKYLRQLLLILVMVSAFFVVGSGELSLEFISGYMVMMSLMVVMSAVSYDDHYKWYRFARVTPISCRSLAGCKYLLGLLAATSGLVLSAVIVFFAGFVVDIPVSAESGIAMLAVLAVGILVLSVLLPLLFKYGSEKSRIMLIGVGLAPALALMVINKLFPSLLDVKEETALAFVKLLPVAALICYFISFLVSVRILKKKEY